ncbi:MAG: hypothetical protein ONB48_01760 [candidate division KSB1 bacterium]|nr:hypothetical protein [candidate division KSB1 bacterium]MDZ7272595.1 hypothetical protein [candidate division KSB1 bacterium]MDZ7284382.1 hypothetical protein [candidate division KSB1 bacterium]MDZ7297222.1 hypothetical protein [candidate division KSB1 bacterium]MDZ7308550.1 hypothetical protein [candidate division KSB1 bacterium]
MADQKGDGIAAAKIFDRATHRGHEGKPGGLGDFVVLRFVVWQLPQKNSLQPGVRAFALFEKSVTLDRTSALPPPTCNRGITARPKICLYFRSPASKFAAGAKQK